MRQLFIIVFCCICHADVTYYQAYAIHPFTGETLNVWGTDSVFRGAGLVATSTDTVRVIRKSGSNEFLGALYFMQPGQISSERFIFHNFNDSFPNEPDTVVLGAFQIGAPITFMYKVLDQTSTGYKDKRLYTGQNRPGIDTYISEVSGSNGLQHAVIGRIDSAKHVVGFDAAFRSGFRQCVFWVENCGMIEVHKIKVPKPVITPKSQDFSGYIYAEIKESLYCPNKTYYTLDGTVPDTTSQVYTSLLFINKAATLRAIVHRTTVNWEDSNWIDSDIAEETYLGGLLPTPVASPRGGTYDGIIDVTLSVPGQPDAFICYTTDGSTPIAGGPVYTQPITIDSTTTLRAIAVKNAYTSSSVMQENYSIVSASIVLRQKANSDKGSVRIYDLHGRLLGVSGEPYRSATGMRIFKNAADHTPVRYFMLQQKGICK